MKKFISLMMAIFCVVTFSMSAFADSITNEYVGICRFYHQ